MGCMPESMMICVLLMVAIIERITCTTLIKESQKVKTASKLFGNIIIKVGGNRRNLPTFVMFSRKDLCYNNVV